MPDRRPSPVDEECTPDGEDPFAGCTAIKLVTRHRHACGYHVAFAVQDKIRNPGGLLKLLEAGGAAQARATVMRMAAQFHKESPELFRTNAGCNLRLYQKKQRESPNTANWFGHFEAFLFMREYKTLDLRFVGDAQNGSFFVTDNEDGLRIHVAFMMHDKRGKTDLGAIMLNDGENQIIFTQEEARVAGALLGTLSVRLRAEQDEEDAAAEAIERVRALKAEEEKERQLVDVKKDIATAMAAVEQGTGTDGQALSLIHI